MNVLQFVCCGNAALGEKLSCCENPTRVMSLWLYMHCTCETYLKHCIKWKVYLQHNHKTSAPDPICFLFHFFYLLGFLIFTIIHSSASLAKLAGLPVLILGCFLVNCVSLCACEFWCELIIFLYVVLPHTQDKTVTEDDGRKDGWKY